MTIEEAIKSTDTMAKAAELINMPFMTFKRKAISLGLYKPNQGSKGRKKPWDIKNNSTKIPLTEILKGLHPQYQSNKLRARLIQEGVKLHKCECCGNKEWLGQPISLEVDHVNGISTDHRLENLRILCPNCHAQTETYRGKNIGRVT
jgi:5-methylcytosine-specific restriction endonuclease McrA